MTLFAYDRFGRVCGLADDTARTTAQRWQAAGSSVHSRARSLRARARDDTHAALAAQATPTHSMTPEALTGLLVATGMHTDTARTTLREGDLVQRVPHLRSLDGPTFRQVEAELTSLLRWASRD